MKGRPPHEIPKVLAGPTRKSPTSCGAPPVFASSPDRTASQNPLNTPRLVLPPAWPEPNQLSVHFLTPAAPDPRMAITPDFSGTTMDDVVVTPFPSFSWISKQLI